MTIRFNKKKIISAMSFLIFFWIADKLSYSVRVSGKDSLTALFEGIAELFNAPLFSFHPMDMLIGVLGAAAVKGIIYLKSKSGKNYRKGIEYGSARWGTPADIKPYMDEKFSNNILLTDTERITMNSRPKNPKYARCVIRDEKSFCEELKQKLQEKNRNKPIMQQNEIVSVQQRLDELDVLITGLYENYITNILPERQYKALMIKYSSEQSILETKIKDLKRLITDNKNTPVQTDRFIKAIKKYKDPSELTTDMLEDLIDKIVIHEKTGTRSSIRLTAPYSEERREKVRKFAKENNFANRLNTRR